MSGHIIYGISSQLVIGLGAVMLQLIKPHICLSPPTSRRPCWYQFISLVNRELLGVSSLSKAICQKPSRRVLNSQPSDPESETLTAWPRTHPSFENRPPGPKAVAVVDLHYENYVVTLSSLVIYFKKPPSLAESMPGKLLHPSFHFPGQTEYEGLAKASSVCCSTHCCISD